MEQIEKDRVVWNKFLKQLENKNGYIKYKEAVRVLRKINS